MKYSTDPVQVGTKLVVNLPEFMHYVHLPVKMPGSEILLYRNLQGISVLLSHAAKYCIETLKREYDKDYYYVSAYKGFATRESPNVPPKWHCSGFCTEDANFFYWVGPGIRFINQEFKDVSFDHLRALAQFKEEAEWDSVYIPVERGLYYVSPTVVHAAPAIKSGGSMRQYIRISVSTEQYNFEDNSHNYLFDYDWKMHPREAIRKDPDRAQRDYF